MISEMDIWLIECLIFKEGILMGLWAWAISIGMIVSFTKLIKSFWENSK